MGIMTGIRTALLLGLLTGILLFAGYYVSGTAGMTVALIFALIMNFGAFWFSDKIVLKMYRAEESKDKTLNGIVEQLAMQADLPKPKVYIVPTDVPNAFATGRSPKKAAVAVTRGLLNNLNKDEIEGVISHELGHIKNRDTLIATLSASIAGAISWLGQMAWWSMFWGDRKEGGNLMLLPFLILAPISAGLIQMAISRSREFQADYTGAYISKKPMSLISALQKISAMAKRHPLRGNNATAHLFIINPFRADVFSKLFSTHPSLEERIKRLKEMRI